MKIGVVGMGRMGAAIAARLIDAGHAVTVWNRSAGKMQPLMEAGATAAATPAALAGSVDSILTILTDGAALGQVFDGTDGLLRAKVDGKLFIEMSTVPPATSRMLADKVRAAGAAFAECPVSGTIGPAREGKLLGLLGADAADAARAMPILDQLCRRVEHVGPVGSGALMKLAVNLPLMIAWQAYGEAFALARDLDIGGDRLLDLFADTSGANNALKGRGPKIAAMFAGRDPGPVTFDITTAIKDLRTMLMEGAARGVSLPLLERTLGCFEDAAKNGFGGKDASMMPVYWTQRVS